MMKIHSLFTDVLTLTAPKKHLFSFARSENGVVLSTNMTTSPTRNGAEALMAIKAISNASETASQDTETGVGKVIGKLSGTDIEYWIRKDKVVIGRNSSHGKVDVNIGMTSYVSRKHLQINYERGRFFLVCIGKNGVFVDGLFQRLGASPMPLDRACVIRFPSTSIRLTFNPHPLEILNGSTNSKVDNESTPVQPQTVESKPQLSSLEVPVSLPYSKPLSPIIHSDIEARKLKREFSSPSLKYMIPRDPRGFLSAPPSPTGTISAVNSCPSSPRREAAQFASQNHNVTEKLTAAASAIANVMQEQNEKGSSTDGVDSKPPYSYAQLIIQAISSAPHRQLTLSGIYAHITKNYPYYRTADKGWQNSIRHNLSLNRYFVKVPRSQEESGKGSFWRVDPASERKLVEQAWRKRRQRAVPCLNNPLAAPGSTITRSAPVSPERSNPISPLSAARRGVPSSQEEIQHPLHSAENDTKLKLVQLNPRYAQSAPGSPSDYNHAVVMTTISDAHLISAISMSQQRASIMTSAGNIPISDNGLGRVIWPLSSVNAQAQGPGAQAQLVPSSLSLIKEEASKRSPVTSGSPAPRQTTVKQEPPKIPLVMQPSSVNPAAITSLTAQQQQQILHRQQQQKFQQQVVMVTGQGHQRVPQAIPINIGTIVAGPNTLVNSGLPFVMPTTGNHQYVVKRINEDSTPVSEAAPAKKAKTEDNTSEP